MFLYLTPFLFFLLLHCVPMPSNAENWAVLVAGAKDNSPLNYGIQADVCHAYQILRQHGIPEDHIITMMWDDIASSPNNVHPGKLYNRPTGPDVYSGIKIDYSGTEVNPENFLTVLRGDFNGKRVLNSTKDDNVFVFLDSHGGPGVVAFAESMLTVKQLNDALLTMHQKGMYKELVFFLDSCFSGSMFNDATAKQLNVYAASAAKADEYSHFDYCEQQGVMNNSDSVCLGSEFSVSWMEYIEKQSNLHTVTLKQLWEAAKKRTLTGDGHQDQISHPLQFGNLAITDEMLSKFFGSKAVQPAPSDRGIMQKGRRISKFDAPLYAAKTEEERQAILKQRAYVDEQMSALARMFVRKFGVRNLFEFPATITQLDCHDQVIHYFHKNCAKIPKKFGVYRHSQIFANVCEQHIDAKRIVAVLKQFCKLDD